MLITYTLKSTENILSAFCKKHKMKYQFDNQSDDGYYYDMSKSYHYIYFLLRTNEIIESSHVYKLLSSVDPSIKFETLYKHKDWVVKPLYDTETFEVKYLNQLHIHAMVDIDMYKKIHNLDILKQSFLNKLNKSLS